MNNLEPLEQITRDVQRRFMNEIEPYRSELWRYCKMLTRSPWDADDLMQETLMKAYATLGQLFQPIYPKPYLFRIASNTWIDHCRKSKRFVLADDEIIESVQSEKLYAEEVEKSCLAG